MGEGVENVGFLRHGGGCWVRQSTKYLQNNLSLVKHAINESLPRRVTRFKDKDPLKVNAKVALTFRKVLQNNDKDINTSCQEED